MLGVDTVNDVSSGCYALFNISYKVTHVNHTIYVGTINVL